MNADISGMMFRIFSPSDSMLSSYPQMKCHCSCDMTAQTVAGIETKFTLFFFFSLKILAHNNFNQNIIIFVTMHFKLSKMEKKYRRKTPSFNSSKKIVIWVSIITVHSL